MDLGSDGSTGTTNTYKVKLENRTDDTTLGDTPTGETADYVILLGTTEFGNTMSGHSTVAAASSITILATWRPMRTE